MSKLILWIIVLGMVVPRMALAEISIAAPHITSLVEKDGHGYYQRIMQDALKEVPFDTNETFYPYKRALLLFENNTVDCIYSFTKVLQDKLGEHKILFSYPLGAFAYYIFSRKDEVPITDSADVVGSRVGAVIGHDEYYRDSLDEGVELLMVDSDRKNIALLDLGRLDYLIGALPDLQPYVPRLSFNEKAPLIESFDRITCHNTEESQAFLTTLSKVLRDLNKSGRYQQLGPELYLPFEE